MCHSLNAPSKEDPRWPEVPKTTRCLRIARIGPHLVVGRDELRNIHQDRRIGRLSGGRIDVHLLTSIKEALRAQQLVYRRWANNTYFFYCP